MRICIIGGRLQGLEAAYLSKKAGIETVLFDKDPEAPASGIADEFHCIDILKDAGAKKILKSSDGILPANENKETLIFLEKTAKEMGVPYLQDNNAFWISSDKGKSKELFDSLEISQPKPWPECGFPVVAKPANMSGSVGIHRANNAAEFENVLKTVLTIDKNVIVQRFISGQALSLELISLGGQAIPIQITELEFDESYGCKRVIAPDISKETTRRQYLETSKKIAEALKLKGLMDTQAIVDENGVPLIIEINARLPSQTPTAVYHSSSINMVSLLVKAFAKGRLTAPIVEPKKTVIFEHIQVQGNRISVKGEHIMSGAKDLRLEMNFFGADEAITNLSKNSNQGVATLIVKDNSREKANERLTNTIKGIMTEYHISNYQDLSPV